MRPGRRKALQLRRRWPQPSTHPTRSSQTSGRVKQAFQVIKVSSDLSKLLLPPAMLCRLSCTSARGLGDKITNRQFAHL